MNEAVRETGRGETAQAVTSPSLTSAAEPSADLSSPGISSKLPEHATAGLSEPDMDRLAAALVGVLAAWWRKHEHDGRSCEASKRTEGR